MLIAQGKHITISSLNTQKLREIEEY